MTATELVVADPGGQARPLAEQIAAARAARPDGILTTVRPGDGDATGRQLQRRARLPALGHAVGVPRTGR
jgi:hypothetical protein